MARKTTDTKKTPAKIATKTKPKPVSSSPVRNSPIPKVAARPASITAAPATTAPAKMKKAITHEMIASRAFEISCSDNCGSEFDNWIRAERELRGF